MKQSPLTLLLMVLLTLATSPQALAVYNVSSGRFLQRDPNATASPVQWPLAYNGTLLRAPLVSRFDLQDHLGDGVNVYEYLASSPPTRSDPAGLFIGLLGPTSTLDVYLDYNQEVLANGRSAKGFVDDAVNGAAWNQLLDAEWALDWSAPDVGYSSEGIFYRSNGAMSGSSGSGDFAVAGRSFKRYSHPLIEYHHVATRYGIWGDRFREIFGRANLSINNAANLVPVLKLHHRSKHTQAYHEFVYKYLDNAVGTKQGAEARQALTKAIDDIAAMLRRDPEMINRK
jgi:hypothetical protein